MNWFSTHIGNTIAGIALAVLAYLAEIKGAVHVMWIIIAFDLIAGIMASLIKRKEKFCMKKVFVAIGRAIGVTVFVALLYAMDKEMNQKTIASYNIAAWLISGFFLWSFAENMFDLTGGRIFEILKTYINKRVENTTGVDLEPAPDKNKLT
ncbi:phage holin family protein [Labilibaculum sp.]|uniref:phage holin family protein n=1 Tax=Labilibaculum sp. TaxID=2060723 RepID=UPI002AA7353A|nr:phage holin family protein [Labilibaculum sp.]